MRSLHQSFIHTLVLGTATLPHGPHPRPFVDIGPWITSFTGLEYLLLAPRGNGLAVRTSLAGLSRLRELVLSVKQHDMADHMDVSQTFSN